MEDRYTDGDGHIYFIYGNIWMKIVWHMELTASIYGNRFRVVK